MLHLPVSVAEEAAFSLTRTPEPVPAPSGFYSGVLQQCVPADGQYLQQHIPADNQIFLAGSQEWKKRFWTQPDSSSQSLPASSSLTNRRQAQVPASPIIGQEQDPAVPAVPDSLQSAAPAELVPLVAELHLLVVQLLGTVFASQIN